VRALIVLLLSLALAVPAAAQDRAAVAQARRHFVAGEAAFKRGDFDAAIREYEAAYALVPRPELLFNIGSAYRRRGETGSLADKRAALEHYRRYLELAPDGKGAPDARRRIEALNAAIAEAETPPPEPPSTPPAPEVTTPAPPAAVAFDAPPPTTRSRRSWRIAGVATPRAGVVILVAAT
jgi:tetratricopeptide (TPR) repeat protein